MHDGDRLELVDIVEKSIRCWSRLGLRRRPGLSEARLNALESELGVGLGPRLRTLYGLTDGNAGADEAFPIDHRFIRLWPGRELRTQAGDSGVRVVFADFLLFSHEYACAPSGEVTIVGPDWPLVAPSLASFLASCLEDYPPVEGAG